MNREGKVLVLGGNGMVGSAIFHKLVQAGYTNILKPSRAELDLLSHTDVVQYFHRNEFDEIYLAAAKVGGIKANNQYPAEFLIENLLIQNNVIQSAYASDVKKLLFLGSSCIYPKYATQPISESSLMSGALEPTNEAYAVAKIAGIKLIQFYAKQYGVDFRSIMPCNLYGPNDNFNLENSHVIPALIRKIHLAKLGADESVTVWGTGNVRREFLHVSDMAESCLHVMNLTSDEFERVAGEARFINVGLGKDITIAELVTILVDIIKYQGRIIFDSSMPDGTPRKLMDNSKVTALGWKPKTSLNAGLDDTYSWYLKNIAEIRL